MYVYICMIYDTYILHITTVKKEALNLKESKGVYRKVWREEKEELL